MNYYFVHLLMTFILISNAAIGQTLPTPDIAEAEARLSDTIDIYDMPAIKVIGKKPRLMEDVPGSAAYIETKTIKKLQPINGNEIFRTISGVHVVEEEGIGLRANIGIRGLDPDRSSKVLIMEDGIPVALNPYGEPQMYYTPPIERMSGIEVLKGSGQILFGPQTIGGVINYITADPSKEGEGMARIRLGEGGYFSGMFSYGKTFDNTGVYISYLTKQADEIGITSFNINDLSAKIKIGLNKNSKLGLKLGLYDETSNSTYIGQTQSMYESGDYDSTHPAPDDELEVRRLSASATHEYSWNYNLKLQTTLFGYTTTRNWQRQDFAYAPTSNMTGAVWGDESIPGGALYMRDQNGHRNRQFEVGGLESRLTYRYLLGKMENKLQAGARFLYERAFEQRVNGSKKDAASGVLKNDEIRTGNAFSAFAQNQFELSTNFSLTGGARMEHYSFERNILRLNEADTSIISNTSITQFIPGIGFNYSLPQKLTVFGGIHRGYAPPRIKDAISNDGTVYNLDPELSWNTELGIRAQIKEYIDVNIAGFYMNFSNQIIPVSESSGGNGSGLVNGGNTLHYGVEGGILIQLGEAFLPEDYLLNFKTEVTYVHAIYNKDRFLDVEGQLINIKDNRTPYSPEIFLSSTLQFEAPFGLGFNFTGTYVGEQFTDELNTIEPSANGRRGKLDAYFVLDAGAQYHLERLNTTFSFSVKNLTNERYITSRRPQGIRVGIPLYLSGGIEVRF